MLRQLGLGAHADRITAATAAVLGDRARTTRDLGGSATTSAMADAIIAGLPAAPRE